MGTDHWAGQRDACSSQRTGRREHEPMRFTAAAAATLLLLVTTCASHRLAAQGQGGGFGTQIRKTHGNGIQVRQKKIYQDIRASALGVARSCASRRDVAGQRWAVRVALRVGGPSSSLESTLKRLQTSNLLKARDAKATEAFKKDQARVAKAAAPLHALWQEALKAKQLSLATEIAQDHAEADPGHDATHKVLGYVKHGDRWMSPRAVKFIEAGLVKDPVFGWLKKDDVAKFHKGLRPLDGEFVPKAQADRAHREPKKPYKILTERFHVFSCRPYEEGVAFARAAEDLCASWTYLFAGFMGQQPEGRLPGVDLLPPRPMRIYYLTDRAQYVKVSGMQGGKGHFNVGQRCSYFYPFGFGGRVDPVLKGVFNHEVGHQLFSAYSSKQVFNMAFFKAIKGPNSFLVEGLATFMEGLESAGGKLYPASLSSPITKYRSAGASMSVVGPLRIRMAARFFRRGINEPLAKLLSIDYYSFPKPPIVRGQRIDRYSQAGAFVYFMMFDANGAYRDDFARYVLAYYHGKAGSPKAIEKYLKKSVPELEKKWKAYMSKVSPL